MNTEELVRRARKGDGEAFYELIAAYKQQLYQIAFSYVKNESDALEAIQEVTYLAFKSCKKLKEPKYFKTWLIRILINHCSDELKQKKRMVVQFSEPVNQIEEHSQMKLELEEEIAKLRAEYQHVIILRYFQELPISEIANILKRPEGTIKTWIHQALKQLKVQMKVGDLDG
ncbi:sigma-70 family RNA polymerase sigma factor [Bacillus sp. FJAT-45350]|uniref:sigma-70 family RNA polymerase sigma factor n=1 Tax=Bacillus sp. FJAT-45350 TaxID=2011014 RepID=UPI000BB7266D|nr:sigma-70 family RNA polymerase sigma factor [Bacillus sp. FJAT-45350]